MKCFDRIVLPFILLVLCTGFGHAQERICADGKRSYFGVCPEDGDRSRPLPREEPQPAPREEPRPPTPSQPAARETFRDCPQCPEMVKIPSGRFLMGSAFGKSDERPLRNVSIKGFSLGKFEVTQREWVALMGTNPSKFKGDFLPVEQVSWNDAQRFIQRLSAKTGKRYRLPTEAEWEYAARAGSTEEYSFGSDARQLGEHAWWGMNSDQKTQAVGQKLPNGFGLYDIHGNVWEWVQDCWNDNYSGAPTDGSAWERGDCSQRMYRGGSKGPVLPEFLRVSIRGRWFANSVNDDRGFRVARTD